MRQEDMAMTLQEWYGPKRVFIQAIGNQGALQVFTDGLDADARWSLYHLSDYVVSSAVSGPSVILVRRKAGDA